MRHILKVINLSSDGDREKDEIQYWIAENELEMAAMFQLAHNYKIISYLAQEAELGYYARNTIECIKQNYKKELKSNQCMQSDLQQKAAASG